MGKKVQKINRKLKEKKLTIAKRERKNRKKRKTALSPSINEGLDIPILVKKNIIPFFVLASGCLIFYFLSTGFENIGNFIEKDATPYASNQDTTKIKISYSSAAKNFTHSLFSPASIVPDGIINLDTDDSEIIDIAEPAEVVATEKITIEPITLVSEKQSQPLSIKVNSPDKETLKSEIKKLVDNTPMESMVEEIAKRDTEVAAFILGIGMKESKYGIYSPKKEGQDCYNYWGYRGQENKTKSGYSCFDNPEHAVKVVGDRIESLVKDGRNTPAEMVVWKCGYSCEGHSQESVNKWIADVSINYNRLNRLSKK